MKFSLILCTLGRTKQLERFLASLVSQSHSLWSLIIVDQNPDERLAPIVDRFSRNGEIRWVRSEKGLSRARNVGLKFADGDIVAFPDDDCWYGLDLLGGLGRSFEERSTVDGFSVTVRDVDGRPAGCRWDRHGGTINRSNIWRRAISTSIFLRRGVVEAVGTFDVELGLGSGTQFGSGEETDYLLRALDLGFRLEYVPALRVFHERRLAGAGALARGRSYGLGFGHVQRKHKYPLTIVFYYWLRSAAALALSIVKLEPAEVRFRWGNLKGRVMGWLH